MSAVLKGNKLFFEECLSSYLLRKTEGIPANERRATVMRKTPISYSERDSIRYA